MLAHKDSPPKKRAVLYNIQTSWKQKKGILKNMQYDRTQKERQRRKKGKKHCKQKTQIRSYPVTFIIRSNSNRFNLLDWFKAKQYNLS